MSNDDVKAIKEIVEVIAVKVNHMDSNLTFVFSQVGRIKDQISVINDKLDKHSKIFDNHTKKILRLNRSVDQIKRKLLSHTASLIEIEKNLGGYKDAYLNNQKSNQDLSNRMRRIEEALEIPQTD